MTRNNNILKDIKIFKLKPIKQKGFDISGKLENPRVEKYMDTVRLELRRVSLNISRRSTRNIGIVFIVLGNLVLLTLWARIIWIYVIYFNGYFITFSIIGDVLLSIILTVIGIIFLGDEGNSTNSQKSAKRLNAFFSK